MFEGQSDIVYITPNQDFSISSQSPTIFHMMSKLFYLQWEWKLIRMDNGVTIVDTEKF